MRHPVLTLLQNNPAKAVAMLLLSWLMGSIGCSAGSEDEPLSVTGAVTVGSRPLSAAVITFEPIERTPGPKASAAVLDGTYRIETSANLRPSS